MLGLDVMFRLGLDVRIRRYSLTLGLGLDVRVMIRR